MILNEAGLLHLFTDLDSPLARRLEDVADRLAAQAKETVGDQWPPGTENPPGSIPFRRSGDLQNSIRSTPPFVLSASLEVDVVASASHRGFDYVIWLQEQQYRFIDLAHAGPH